MSYLNLDDYEVHKNDLDIDYVKKHLSIKNNEFYEKPNKKSHR